MTEKSTTDRILRIAFCGCSGTGKSTLTAYVAERYGLAVNPVGSRSVAAEMGFSNPYDVDGAGQRPAFQRRLLAEKHRWEGSCEAFATDRTPLDNLAYSSLHAIASIDDDFVDRCMDGMKRYTHVFFCPAESFQQIGTDPARVASLVYHQTYEILLRGFLDLWSERDDAAVVRWIHGKTREDRIEEVDSWIERFDWAGAGAGNG